MVDFDCLGEYCYDSLHRSFFNRSCESTILSTYYCHGLNGNRSREQHVLNKESSQPPKTAVKLHNGSHRIPSHRKKKKKEEDCVT
jgi:hypothetical protein